MSAKQDGVYTRTASDLERKYQFGKTFSEIIGLVNDTREDVDSVESGLMNEITKQSTSIRRDVDEIVMEAKETITKETDGKIETINKELESKMTASEFSLAFKNEVAESGISVRTGYSFTKDGLKITDSSASVQNLIDESGMYVTRNGDSLLTANDKGVEAVDLHAKTYLIIGSGEGRSRFEDYGVERTGCFWIGG